ncbi:hypothetical protein ITX31_00705 [Arthrobacter gandavensis]|uniref:hypothetical protein n=1 Tax=Arthrobacter gandavensis TaxID=169960 RepID=UPI00188E8E92|nr:hypothetical protein [Arthrobacter gandavensis]MBF4992630.1 hypothetical protein [Arthrobacter gandavensis]
MHPHPDRPASPEEGMQTAAAKDGTGRGSTIGGDNDGGNANRSGTNAGNANGMPDRNDGGPADWDSAAFVPPLAPAPPPGTPPTVHTRMEENRRGLGQGIAEPGERPVADVQQDSFGSILLGEPTGGPPGRAYHLRNSLSPAQAFQRLVAGRAALETEPIEAGQADCGQAGGGQPGSGQADAKQPGSGQADSKQHGSGQADSKQPGSGQHEASSGADDPPDRNPRDNFKQRDNIKEEDFDNGQFQNERSEDHGPSQADTVRRTAVTVCTAAALGASYALTRTATGWPDINHSAGTVLDPAASLLGAYPWIWLAWIPVLAGAAAYAALQWMPSQRSNPRQAWSGPISAGSAVAAAIWLWAVQTGNPAAAFGAAALGTGIGLAAIHVCNIWPGESRTEKATIDLPAKVLLGVSTVGLLTGLGGWLTALGTDVAGWGPEAWALIALVATTIGITTVSMTDRGHLAAALTVVVGLTGIGFSRLLSEQTSMPVAAGAFVGAFLVLVSAGSRRHQVDHAQRRRQREWLKAEASVPAADEAPEAVRT